MIAGGLVAPLALAMLAGKANAQLYTTTLPVEDGNTLIISTGTNALGVTVTQTMSTIWSYVTTSTTSTGTGTATGLSSSSSSSASSSSSSSSSRAPIAVTTPTTTSTSTAALTTPTETRTGTTRLGVGGETALPPAQTYTYWFQDVEHTWIAPVTTVPTVATAIVPQGTPLVYSEYQSIVNGRVFESAQAGAEAQAASNAASTKAGRPMGFASVAVGLMAGAGFVLWV